ncbi:MAG: 3'-5' exonuclease, partial [Candidatus Woesearchaeota archaeon]
MREIDPEEVTEKLKTGELNYINFYNNLEPQQYFSISHYLKNPNDTIDRDQRLNILFQDIEVYSYESGNVAPDSAKSPISSNTLYSSFEKTYHTYFLILRDVLKNITEDDIESKREEVKKELLDNEYIKKDEDIQFHIYENEFQMIKDFWMKIHELDCSVLTGFFFDGFDLPYIYNRIA